MSGRTLVFDSRKAEAWEEAKAFILKHYPKPDDCERRLRQELDRIENLPSSIELTIKIDSPLAIWRALVLATECSPNPGHDDLMITLHEIAPFLVDWGFQVGQKNVALLKEACKKATESAAAPRDSNAEGPR